MGVNLSDLAAGRAQPRPRSEGRCIPRFQVYRMSAQTDRLLVWRSIRCDALGPNVTLKTLGLKTSQDHSTRPGSRSSPRFSVQLTKSPLLSPVMEPY